MSRSSIALTVVVVALVLSAWSTATDTSTTIAAEPTTSTAVTGVTTTTTPPTDTTDGDEQALTIDEHLAWFLTVLNGAEVSEAEYESRFAQVFRNEVAYADFVPLTGQITGGLSGWTVVDTETSGTTNLVVLIAPSAGAPLLRLLMNIDSEGRLDGLFIQPAEPPELDDPPESYDEAFERLAALGTAGVLVAETTDGTCAPIAETSSAMALPLGSMFKLYVLGAVVDAVAEGEIGWHDSVTLTEANYSLPSGITQDADPGSTLTVQLLAQRMIEISDNTATDHLIALVGREAVGEFQSEMNHSDPSLNQPFLTTRELFQMKLGDGTALSGFVDGDSEARRQVLAQLADEPLPDLSAAVGWTEPVAPLTAEWFGSTLDLCNAWIHLADQSTEAGLDPIVDIASANPGLPDPTGVWDEIWFKGGSEPGVLGTAWYLTVDDRSFVVAGSVANENRAFDETEAVLLFGAIRDLLATEVAG